MQTQAATSQRGWLPILLGALVSGGAILLLFSQVDLEEFFDHLRNADQTYILGMILLYPVAIVVRAIRWQVLLREPMSFWRAMHIQNIGFMLNTLLPLRLGEVARVLLMSREPKQGAGAGLSALTLERLLDVIMALLCVGSGLLLLPEDAALPPETTTSIGFFIMVALVMGLGVLFISPLHPLVIRIATFFLRPLPDHLAHKLLGFIEDTLHGFKAIAEPKRLFSSLLSSVILWAIYAGYYQLGLYAFIGTDAPVGAGLLTLGAIAVGGAAPSLPGAVGVFQAAAVIALTAAGYDTSIATSYAWGVWVPANALVIVAGALSLWAMGLSFGQITQDVRASAQRPQQEQETTTA